MRLAALALLLLAAPAARADDAPRRETPFPDVPRDHWAFSAVEELREKGILRGYPGGTFARPPARPAAPPKPAAKKPPRRPARR